MKKKVAVFMVLLGITIPAQCQAKKLKKHKLYITPNKVIEAAIEVLTCTTENPDVKRVEVKEVNGRKTVVTVNSGKKQNSKRP